MADPMAAMAADPRTLVIQIDTTVNANSLKTAMRAGTPLRSSPAFMKLYDRREKGASAWGMVQGTSKLFEPLAGMNIKPKSVDGTLTVSDKFTGTMRATMNSADDAKKLADDVNKMSAMAKRFVEKLDVRADGQVVNLDAAVTDAQLQSIMMMTGGGF